jgi:hypothetical protein
MRGTRPGSSILLFSAGAAEVFMTRTGDENCASLRRGLRKYSSADYGEPSNCCK